MSGVRQHRQRRWALLWLVILVVLMLLLLLLLQLLRTLGRVAEAVLLRWRGLRRRRASLRRPVRARGHARVALLRRCRRLLTSRLGAGLTGRRGLLEDLLVLGATVLEPDLDLRNERETGVSDGVV